MRIIGACLIAGTFCSLQGENSQVNLKCGTSYDLSAKDPTLAASLETIVSKIENQFETKELCAINHVLGNSGAPVATDIKDEVKGRIAGLVRNIEIRQDFETKAPIASRRCARIPARKLTDNEYHTFNTIFFDDNEKYKEPKFHEKRELCDLLLSVGNSTPDNAKFMNSLAELRKRIHSIVTMSGLKSWYQYKKKITKI